MASPNIAFDSIPSSIRKPGKYFEFNTKLAVRTLPGNPQRVLMIGQRLMSPAPLTGGAAAPLTIVDVFSDDDAATLFGAGSQAHLMAAAAIGSNSYLQLQMIGIADATAAKAATATVTLTGPATAGGVLSLWVGTQRIDTAVSSSDPASLIAAEAVTQVNQHTALPVTAAAAEGVITLTAKNAGTIGNDIHVKAHTSAAGITATVAAFTGGEIDPDIAPALAAAFSAGHNIVVCPFTSQPALTALRTHLELTGGALEQRGAIGVAGWPKSLATGTTLTETNNCGRITVAWHPGSVKLPAEIAAAYAAVIASEEDPARPLNTLTMRTLDVTPLESRPSRNEQENALRNGLTPFEIGPGDTVQIVRSISTYTRNAEGIDDVSLLDITTIRTLDYVRKACRERISLRFPRDKLSARTAPKVRSELLDVLYKLEDLEIIEEVDANKEKLFVERDSQDVNRLNAAIPADVVNGLLVFAGRIDLYL